MSSGDVSRLESSSWVYRSRSAVIADTYTDSITGNSSSLSSVPSVSKSMQSHRPSGSQSSNHSKPVRLGNPLVWLQEWIYQVTNRVQDPKLKKRKSSFLGDGASSHPGSLFPSGKAGGLMAPEPNQIDGGSAQPVSPGNSKVAQVRKPSPWSFRSWKKFTLDFYVRLLDRPQDSRFRLKQTIALLPFLKLKPTVDFSANPTWLSPVRMRLDIKFLGCFKYRVRQDGSSFVIVRARTPLADPRFALDVVYVRDLLDSVDSVKLTFRALDIAFLKAPRFGAGCKIPVNFSSGVKSTIRVKKFLLRESSSSSREKDPRGNASRSVRDHRSVNRSVQEQQRSRGDMQRQPRAASRSRPRISRKNLEGAPGIYGPAGIDVKTRLWEFGNDPAISSPSAID